MSTGDESQAEHRWMDAAELARRVATGSLSASEVVGRALERIERLDPHLHAFCTLCEAEARREAVRSMNACAAARGSALEPAFQSRSKISCRPAQLIRVRLRARCELHRIVTMSSSSD